jgi:hypothetical protein
LAFVKHYNSAYEFFVLRYLREGGMNIDANLSLDKASSMAVHLSRKELPSLYEEKFLVYVKAWKSNPKYRPSGRFLLEGLFGTGGKPDAAELLKLEAQLPPGAGKLVLSKEDVGKEIADFYTGYFRDALRQDLAVGEPKQLHLYIEPSDEMRVQRTPMNPEPSDAEVMKLCRGILSSIEGVTPEAASRSVDIALKEHFDRHDHMVQPSYYHGTKRVRVCRHKVGLISLRGTVSQADKSVQFSLTPLRGSPLCEARGDVPIFPWFDVTEFPSSA